MLEYLLIIIALIICVIGSYTDLKIREVPDWLNYGGMIAGVCVHAIAAVVVWNGWYLFESLFGLGIGFAIGSLMYYSGQWGGGDSKLLMALGALLGFSPAVDNLFFSTLVYVAIAGAFYGLAWSIVLALINWKKFSRVFSEYMREPGMKIIRKLSLVSVIAGVVVQFFAEDFLLRMMLALLLVFVPLLVYMFFCIRAVEKCCMLRNVPPSVITEGDWIAKDVIVGGRHICGPKDLGITIPQLELLQRLEHQGKIRKVLVKYGIPFVPSFLLGLVAALLLQNPLMFIM